MLSEWAVFRSNQRTSLEHDAKCRRLLLHNVVNNNNNNNITSMELKSLEARAQKRNKDKSQGHTGVIISFKRPKRILVEMSRDRLFKVEKQFCLSL